MAAVNVPPAAGPSLPDTGPAVPIPNPDPFAPANVQAARAIQQAKDVARQALQSGLDENNKPLPPNPPPDFIWPPGEGPPVQEPDVPPEEPPP